jgi:hypothetical protein
MAARGKAAITPDELLDRPLGDLSAAQFLQVLNHPKVSRADFQILADKKKYELWVEEDPILKINVGELLEKIKGEKKKVEKEIPDIIGPVVNPPFERAELVEEIATLVELRMRGK